ncbi:MAG TPA: tetratricopeptide repeat protein [Usitatibacter sp.]|nr:tetratricopeptide repeat protein [Usitatibacter sp.]
MSDPRIEEARRLHQRGDLPRAIAAYGEVLAADPEVADVWHLKAAAEQQAGRLQEARESVRRAIDAGGERLPYLLLDGLILHDLGDLAQAERRFARVVDLKPDLAAGHFELGRVRMDQGRVPEAIKDFQAAVAADGKHLRAWNNLGVALQSVDRLDDAVRAFNYALSLDAGYPLAHFNLARIHKMRGDRNRALEHARIAVSGDPTHVEAWLLLGDIHVLRHETAGGLAAYASAVKADPGNLKARITLVDTAAAAGGYAQALPEFRRIAAEFPTSLRAALPANLLLPQVYEDLDQLQQVRDGYEKGLARLQSLAPTFRFAGRDSVLADARWTNFYLAYQGKNDREPQKRYGEFLRSVLRPAVPQFYEPRTRHPGRDRIRVGFLSHFFFNCTAGRYFASWATRLDRSRFETFVYYTNEWVADDTREIAASVDRFRHLPGRPLDVLAQEVLADQLDILVYPELGMHSETFTLGSLRLAPVQCSGWGHPDTTGHPEIDWFISCEAMEPPDAASHYSERLALLPGLGTRYVTPRTNSTRSRADFGLPEGRTLYLVPQSLFKIHPDNDALIARTLERDPDGVAVMFASNHAAVTEAFAGRLIGSFEERGLDLHERTCFLAPQLAHPEYLRLNQLCDVMLDTRHWSGGNTSLDALSMGLPVVTLPGALMRGRQSQAMLRMVGAHELVAGSVDEYLAIAERLGRDAAERAAVSDRIRANLGELFERDEPVRALEAFLERAAREG